MTIKLTVAICTWNRADLLSQTLSELSLATPPQQGWEVVVVNNKCTDTTDEVIARFQDSLPLRRVYEGEPGLSNARNAALDNARGAYIVWTDDDILMSRNWLTAYETAFASWPQAAVFGGPIRPWFDGQPPDWLASVIDQIGSVYGVRDLAAEPCALELPGKLPYGANYAVRTLEQRLHRYDAALGRKGKGGALGEETAVLTAIMKKGGTGRWIPQASVRHFIPRDHQTLQYLRAYYTLCGRTQALAAPLHGTTLLGRPLWTWRGALQAEIQYRLMRLTGDPRKWIEPLTLAAELRGALRLGELMQDMRKPQS
ncbi:MAG: glycosyltransferase family 2 protein [Burkholderiaceae bacterium]|nr:glycosyltransferase family 2 protein [Burkholderiaceae bacterium]MBP8308017.1 glycosyltransferase family 2 protein [Burkholderiaceae bacterium]